MLSFPQNIYNEIINHAKETYPYEACGALAGKQKQGSGRVPSGRGQGSRTEKDVLKFYSMENINKDRANDRYEINPKELLKIEKEAKANGLQVIGFYHSHPDHPDRPSALDKERAWPLYSYVIIAVHNGRDVSVKSWTFEDEREPFREEEVKTV
ncbi:MAG: M67 family metallopeptidase [Deltaproteobacteria bacterium]|nr:M67 family metallopeptidase [Deltaproteobacteria bacterium]